MERKKSRSLLVGLGAAVAAFGAAAMTSAATAPTARADDFTALLTAVEDDLSAGQTDFTSALTDFGSIATVPHGLALFFDGVDEDAWSVPTNLEVGTVEALTGSMISNPFGVGLPIPTDFSDAVSIAETSFSEGQTNFTDAVTALSSGDYVAAVQDDALGSLLAFYFPGEELLIGGAEALGL